MLTQALIGKFISHQRADICAPAHSLGGTYFL